MYSFLYCSAIRREAKALKSFIIRDSDFNDFELTVATLAKYQDSTLETLIFDDEGDMRSSLSSKFYPYEFGEHFRVIRIFTWDMADIILDTPNDFYGDDEETYLKKFALYFKSITSPSSEILVYQCSTNELEGRHIRAIINAIIRLIEDQHSPKLSAIYLDEVITLNESINSADSWQDWSLERSYCDPMITFAGEKGIKIMIEGGSTARYVDGFCNGLFNV